MSREVPVRFREGLGVQFPRATRLVICCRGTANQALPAMRSMIERLKLTVNETKTKLCRVPAETFDFLGYTFGRFYSPRTGGAYLGHAPSQQKVRKFCEALREEMGRNTLWLEPDELVARLNRKLRGWANYFRAGSVNKAYRHVDRYVEERLCHWWRAKYKKSKGTASRCPRSTLPDRLGVLRLRRLPRRPPVCDSMKRST
jgi:RNA-directed DNA polymerase